MESKDRLRDGDYLAAFMDGEGHFAIRKTGNSFSLFLQIKQRADKVPVLEKLCDVFGGSLYMDKRKGTNSSPTVAWQVNARQDIQRLLVYFDCHALLVKAEEYKVWREAALFYYRHAASTSYKNQSWVVQAMDAYKAELSRLKKYQAIVAEDYLEQIQSKQVSLW